jgi:hypothetical protein
MPIINTWNISQLDTKPQEGQLIDVVVTIHWTRNANINIENKYYSSFISGQFSCITPSETDFTAYPDLTFEQVCGWLDSGLDIESIDLYLSSQIENQINPPIIVLPLPWGYNESDNLNK